MTKEHSVDALTKLIQAADHAALGELVLRLAATRPELRRMCLEYLEKHVTVAQDVKSDAGAQAVLSLWDELEPDLADLDEYGGGDYATQDMVGSLLYDLCEGLNNTEIPQEDRRALLDEVIPFIQSGNSGMEDDLYDVAYATCRDDADWRNLAERLETLDQDWPCRHAREIYRRIGDAEKYLALRQRRMECGADYHDLATFHWERGEGEKALAIGREGLDKASGQMEDLRAFMAERAKQSGDRHGYLELQFAQAAERLTLAKYKVFKKMCNGAEWRDYEPRILAALKKTWTSDQLEIHMHRKEHEHALAILSKERYPIRGGLYDSTILKVAARLEKAYPEAILAFYMTGLGSGSTSGTRTAYACQAAVVNKIRHMWLDILDTPDQWVAFAQQLKTDNARRPAFQEEFANVIPGWRDL